MKLIFLILFMTFITSCNQQINLSIQSANVASGTIVITSASIESGNIILKGNNLVSVTKVTALSSNLSGYNMVTLEKSAHSLKVRLTHALNNSLALAAGTVLSFVVSTAHAQTTVNLTIETTPPGTVSAFNLTTCPSGWSDYVPAEGRFIAGVDPSDSSHAVGDISAGELPVVTATLDLFSTIIGTSMPTGLNPKIGNSGPGPGQANIYVNSETSSVTPSVSGNAKPAHVLLKYCEKN